MKKILVIGLSDNIGGIETFFHTYYKNMDKKVLHFDFATVCKTIAFSNEYKKNGSTIFELPNFMKHPIRYYQTLRKIMRENSYDIVHINMLSAANILPIKAAKKEGIKKIIVHSHNSDTPKGFLRKVLDKINSHTLKDDGLIKLACGKKAGEWLFGKKTKFTIVNNAIDINKFKYSEKNRHEIRAKYKIKNSEILLGNVGRLCEQKNQSFLINTLRSLDKKYKLMIIGSGDKETELKKQINNYSLCERVIFVENTAEIEKFYSAFDIFVFPSLFEGVPVAPIEAQANGLKTIVSNNVTHEIDLNNCVFLSLNNEIWYDEIRSNSGVARKTIDMQKFDIKNQYKKLGELYGTK